MSTRFFVILFAAASSAALLATAQQPILKINNVQVKQTSVSSGKQMYDSYCAACHGATGVGNGPAASALKEKPVDLTALTQKNGGTFPTNHVMSVLKFGTENPAHGNAAMPVWGPLLGSLNSSGADSAQVKLRISNITDYIKELQK